MIFSARQFAFSVTTSSTTVTTTSNVQLNAQQWYHLAVSYDGGVAGSALLCQEVSTNCSLNCGDSSVEGGAHEESLALSIGPSAGMIRLFRLDTEGHGQTASDCVDAQVSLKCFG